MVIPYRTTKFKCANIFIMAIKDPTAKFNSRQYFQLYGIIAMQAYNFVSYTQEQNINITGVNTVSDRESIPGYRDIYVKCCCSHGGLQKLQTELKILTGKEVNIRKII